MVNLNSTDMTTERYDHEGLKIVARLAWGNILEKLHSEGRIAQMVEGLARCWLSDDVIRVLQRYGLDPEEFGYEVQEKVARCSE